MLLLQCCYWGLGCNHNRWRILQAVSLVLSPAVLISQPTPLMQSVSGSMTLAISIRPGSTVAHTQSKASDMLVCQPSSAIRSARSDNLAASIAPVLIGQLRAVAQGLAGAGVPLDPEDLGTLVVLAQLTLLDVDLEQDPAKLVEDLNVPPPAWIGREAAERGEVETRVTRSGRSARFHADL